MFKSKKGMKATYSKGNFRKGSPKRPQQFSFLGKNVLKFAPISTFSRIFFNAVEIKNIYSSRIHVMIEKGQMSIPALSNRNFFTDGNFYIFT